YSAFGTGGQFATPVSTSTVLSSNAVSTIFGQSITFTATVSPSTATGTVQFNDSSTILGTDVVSSGHATFTTSSLSIGSHNIVAKYLGDANDAASTSAPLAQTVNQVTITTTTLTSSQNPSTISHSVTFTATVSPSTATGTVQFNDSSTSPSTILGTSTILSGQATFTTQSLSIGSHNIVAKYLGDANDAPSTSTFTQTVNQISISTTTTTLASSQNPSTISHSVTFTATVSPSTATGTVQFNDSSTILGTGVVSSGHATFTTSSLSIGSHNIVAKYLGDANDATSNSSALTQTVNQITTTTAVVSSSANPSSFGQSVSFTVTITPNTATGTVQFAIDGVNTGSPVTLSGGTATISSSSLSVGTHTITAAYSGDTNDIPSSSALTQIINQITLTTTATTLTSSQNPSTIGSSVTFTATVSPSTATGTVQFNDSSTILGTGVVSSGHATFTTSSLSAGSHNIVAKYLGDTNDATSTSAQLAQTVNQVTITSSTISLSSNTTSTIFGHSVTFTATVSPSTATGTVQLLLSGTNFGSPVALSGGQAIFTTSSIPVGTYSLTASYSGNTNFGPSTSNSVPISTIITIGGSGSTPGSVGGNNDDNDEKNSDNDKNNGNHNDEKNSDKGDNNDEKNSDNDKNNGNHNGEKNSDDGNGEHGENGKSKQKQNHSGDKHGDD
ncbi:MAG TPA: Ig-like domain repeat protein, partial [Nitrosopumilaceae archaeon]|nr:Ig-like domain repeat protein [Nitrosopumilaceae archaeon]